MGQVKILGRTIKYDIVTDEITFKASLASPEVKKHLEKLASDGKSNILIFDDTNSSTPKTYPQLTRYYAMLKTILLTLGFEPNSKNMDTLDDDAKKRALPCEYLEIEGQRVPVPPPSKANMTIDQLNVLMEFLESTYAHLKINWENPIWY